MKALPKKLLPLILFGIAVTSLFSVRPAQAYTLKLKQVGSNVVATGSGPMDLSGVTFVGPGQVSGGALIAPNVFVIGTGPTGLVNFDVYSGSFTGPTNFGSGLGAFADTGSGDFVGINVLNGLLFVPQGYVSGSPLSDSMTFENATLDSLGVTPGHIEIKNEHPNGLIYSQYNLWCIGPSVPDGGSTVSLLGCALLGLAALRRKLGC